MAKSWPVKDPDEVLDYDVDWTRRLYDEGELALADAGTPPETPSDTIATSTFVLPDQVGSDNPLVADSTENTTTRTKVWLSGGVIGQSYEIVNRIVTAGGRTMDQTVKLKIKTK